MTKKAIRNEYLKDLEESIEVEKKLKEEALDKAKELRVELVKQTEPRNIVAEYVEVTEKLEKKRNI